MTDDSAGAAGNQRDPVLPIPSPDPGMRPGLGMLKAVPGIARVATASAWNAMNWSVHATRTGAEYLARRAVDGEPPAMIMQEAAGDLRNYAVRVLGLNASGGPGSPERAAVRSAESTNELLRRGEELLRRSN